MRSWYFVRCRWQSPAVLPAKCTSRFDVGVNAKNTFPGRAFVHEYYLLTLWSPSTYMWLSGMYEEEEKLDFHLMHFTHPLPPHPFFFFLNPSQPPNYTDLWGEAEWQVLEYNLWIIKREAALIFHWLWTTNKCAHKHSCVCVRNTEPAPAAFMQHWTLVLQMHPAP